MKLLALLLLSAPAFAQSVIQTDSLPVITAAPGVTLRELSGKTAPPDARSDKVSVAWFRLEPGKASAWSHNKLGEESFFVLSGEGEVWTGSKVQPVRAGSYIVIQPATVRSIRASKGVPLEFYAITSPAWSSDDDVLTTAPAGAPK
ncbi:cupin domain-containing protein [Pseudoduganella sp. FT25W]|uniref:Cupin domain-containing protein n=1 Tax=Duganella alba TaxID=2666081 RepID=A0A6L5QC12_9BURK|nr:cupin domain-containing protein [Duganella alba]MRX07255.1 cupin domain-containing protein [Duganella alba]MRX15050.1 cupin domain-containing protein [Duganella alba]